MKTINDIISESRVGPIKKLDTLTIMIAYQMWKEYKLEENIEYIKISIEKSKEEFEKEYEEYKNEEFIIVDRDFLERMKIQYHPHHKIKLNINEEENWIKKNLKIMMI